MSVFGFFKHKTAYEMRISDWSSDVCSSDLMAVPSLYGYEGYMVTFLRNVAEAEGYEVVLDEYRSSSKPNVYHRNVYITKGEAKSPEARRAGQECVRKCRQRSAPQH